MEKYTKLIRIKHNNKKFDVFVGSNHKKEFLEVKTVDNTLKYYHPILKDLIELNYIYNYDDKKLYSKKFTFKQKVTVLGLTISIEVLALAFNGYNNLKLTNYNKDQEKKYQIVREIVDNEDLKITEEYNNQMEFMLSNKANYETVGLETTVFNNDALTEFGLEYVTFDDVRETLKENNNIDGKYLEYVLEYIDLLEERLPDVDLRIFNGNLKGLKFEIIENDEWDSIGIDGYYIPLTNCIRLKKEYKNHSQEKTVVFHELTHTLNNSIFGLEMYNPETNKMEKTTAIKRFYKDNYGKSVSEGMTTIITDYLLEDDYESYFTSYEYHRYISYGDIAPTYYQLIKIMGVNSIYDYLNGHIDSYEQRLKTYDLNGLVDLLDTVCLTDDYEIEDNIMIFDEYFSKIVERRIKKLIEDNENNMQIYEKISNISFGKPYEDYIDTNYMIKICSDYLKENNYNSFNLIPKTDNESLKAKIYLDDEIILEKELNKVFVCRYFAENNYFFAYNEDNKYYDLLMHKEIESDSIFAFSMENLTNLCTKNLPYNKIKSNYEIEMDISILDDDYVKQILDNQFNFYTNPNVHIMGIKK